MTPLEYADKLRLQLVELQQLNKPLTLAVTTTTADMASRIFIKGIATDGGKIGNYNDTNYLYLNPTNAKIFGRSKIGNPGKFKNGNERKTVKLTYKEYKARLDKPSGGAYVNLELTGDMKSDFTNRNPERITPNEYIVAFRESDGNGNRNYLKAIGNEERFGKKIFFPTKQELDKLYSTLEFELKKLFS